MRTGRIDVNDSKVKLDVKDYKILSMLSEDSRTPLSQIAKQVALSRDAVDYRIKRMMKLNVILCFIPRINMKKFGYYNYHVFFLVEEENEEKKSALIKELINHPNVHSLIEYSDTWDFEAVIIAKDIEYYDELIMDIMNKHPDVILQKERMATTKIYSSYYLPIKITGEKRSAKPKQKGESKIDDKDIGIITSLSNDCRKSTYDIAKEVGLSADAVGYRIKQMKQEGVIEKFTILVNLSALGYSWYSFACLVKKFDRAAESKYQEFAAMHPFILKSLRTLGNWQFLSCIVADTPGHFHNTVKEIKKEFSDVITTYQTWVAYKEHVYVPFPAVIKKEWKGKA